jgi:hypothetical protein
MEEPAKQGAFDGACGLYSIGNALSYLCPEKSKDEIFYEVFGVYHRLYGDSKPLVDGIYRGRVNKVLTVAIDRLKLPCTIKCPYWAPKKTPSLSEYKGKLQNYGDDSVFILGYEYCKTGEEDYYSHWTVITKVTEKSMKTFDSDLESPWIPFAKCRVWDEKSRHSSRPYRISYTDTFVVYRKKKR